jgi:hypothetical protein
LIVNSAAEFTRELELLINHVDRDDPPSGDRRVLDREVAETADAEHGNEIRGARARDLDRLVGGDARAGERRGVKRVDAVGDLDHVAGVGDGVLAEAAVDRIAHHLLLVAQCLPARHAIVAAAARVAEPRHRHTVTDADLMSAVTDGVLAGRELRDDADALVAGDERRRGLDRPVAARGVDVGVAQATHLDLDADLPWLERWHRDLLDGQWAAELVHDGRAVAGGCVRRGLGLGGGCGGHVSFSLGWIGDRQVDLGWARPRGVPSRPLRVTGCG